jgi:hypothetical protein
MLVVFRRISHNARAEATASGSGAPYMRTAMESFSRTIDLSLKRLNRVSSLLTRTDSMRFIIGFEM